MKMTTKKGNKVFRSQQAPKNVPLSFLHLKILGKGFAYVFAG